MASHREALHRLLDAISAMREAGYTQEDVQELVTAAFEHLEDDPRQPYAYGHCTNCNKLVIGWSVYQWSVLVRKPCPKCGKPW